MEHIPHLDQLAALAAFAVLVSVLLAKLRLPAVAGLLVAGALAGPHGLGLVGSSDTIDTLAEVGVVFLLFSIGLEMSLARLRAIARQAALGGTTQVVTTILVVAGVALAVGETLPSAVVYGFIFALSSTAIVLRALSDRREINAPHGRFLVAALVFQDLCVVPMVLVIPVLGSGAPPLEASLAIAWALLKALVLVAAVLLVSRWVVPRALAWVDASKSREVFLLAVLGLCIGTAWLTSLAGLSLALGAFLGGMVVADTEFGDRALGDVLPLRDAFVSVFFVSLGMLFDCAIVLAHPVATALLLFGFLVGKGVLATIACLVMRFPARVAWLAGVGLAQFGEFGFVLASIGVREGVVEADAMRTLLCAGVLSMIATPVLLRVAPHLSAGERLLAPLARLLGARSIGEIDETERLSGHVVIVGYGMAGQLLTNALGRLGIRHVVVELDAEEVRAARRRGEPVYYGDATSRTALEHASLRRAIALVLVANDPTAMARAVSAARSIAPDVPIIVRAHYLRERATLEDRGANEVVSEEVEAGVEILVRVLRRLEIPRNLIEARVRDVRTTLPVGVRPDTLPRNVLGGCAELARMKVDSIEVRPGSHAEGRTLADIDLRRRTGVTAFAIRRDGELGSSAALADALRPGDVIFVVGSGDAVRAASELIGDPADGGRLIDPR